MSSWHDNERVDEVADVIGTPSVMSLFCDGSPTIKQYVEEFKRGAIACARSDYVRPPHIYPQRQMDFAFLDGWVDALNKHHGTTFRDHFEARRLD